MLRQRITQVRLGSALTLPSLAPLMGQHCGPAAEPATSTASKVTSSSQPFLEAASSRLCQSVGSGPPHVQHLCQARRLSPC